VGDEEVVVGEGVVVTSSSLDMLTNSYLGGIMVSLIFLKGLDEEALVEFMVLILSSICVLMGDFEFLSGFGRVRHYGSLLMAVPYCPSGPKYTGGPPVVWGPPSVNGFGLTF
ncbi:hypothetical protein Tco_0630020, partial [Tanacetum coccineum]